MQYPLFQPATCPQRGRGERSLMDKLRHAGPHSLSDAELISIFASPRSFDKIREHLCQYQGIRGLLDNVRDTTLSKTLTGRLEAALELSRRYLEAELRARPVLSNPDKTKHYVRAWLSRFEHEVFACLFLDNRHRIISNEILFTGTIDGASVYPREVVKRCLQLNAAAIIFSHNHPSGIAEPSQADRQITLKLTQALALVDVRVLDHLVVGDKTVTSMAERGLM
ncbi:MAG: DNA repair protein RadC [Gammaproteobacteria bacterium]|nr:DNA repair protein RadC [Gammaproteobacteria bacterium]